MYSLLDSLLAQHPRQLTPIRCAPSTIAQLHRYFEEVVLENNLAALVIESLPKAKERSVRETSRVKELVQAANKVFLFVSTDDALSQLILTRGRDSREAVVFEQNDAAIFEHFVVIADAGFSALLVSTTDLNQSNPDAGGLVVWTFEPDVVYSALEYLIARVTHEYPDHATSFANAVCVSMPKATSVHLTLGVTTKLARLLQEQAEREIAVNRIATAIRNSLELDSLLATAVHEVGRALNVKSCAVQVEGELVGETKSNYYFRSGGATDDELAALVADVELIRSCLPQSPMSWVIDGDKTHDTGICAQAAVPLIYEGAFVGLLVVETDDADRVWADNELLLLHIVADQLTVAVKQAHLFSQLQVQALTDGLTGCYNRRAFEMQLERDLHLATRMRQPLSLIMIDLDNFKDINDRSGHGTGDIALQTVADSLKQELRAVDSAARFGGDEFAIILPQANESGALIVAERLRKRISATNIRGYGKVTASIGLASFPIHAASRDLLVVAADRALYESKRKGRNCISSAFVEVHDFGDEERQPATVFVKPALNEN